MGAITRSAQGTNVTYGVSGSSLSISDSVSGPNRIAVFTCHRFAGSGGFPPCPNSVKYDNVAMTQVGDAAQTSGAYMFRASTFVLAGFNLGAKSVVWTSTYANWEMWGICTTYTNSKSYSTNANMTGDSATPTFTDSAMAINEMLFAAMTGRNTISTGSGVTSEWNSGIFGDYSKIATSAGSMSIVNSMTSAPWCASGVTLIYAPSGGNRMLLAMSKMQKFYDELKRGLIAPDLLQQRYRETVMI